MQEEIEQKSAALMINGTKFSLPPSRPQRSNCWRIVKIRLRPV